MSDDLLSVLTGGKADMSSVDAPAPQGDPAVWTALGEAGTDPEGQRAVASTYVNRMKVSGAPDVASVATNPANGYEAWQDPKARAAVMRQYPADSPAYLAAQANIAPIVSGAVPPPYAYDSFYSPKAQTQLGRDKPSWDDGTGTNIGGNLFFAGKYSKSGGPPADLLSIMSGGKLNSSAVADNAPVAPEAPAPTAAAPNVVPQAAPADASPAVVGGVVYDPKFHVTRNPDGSIAGLGDTTPGLPVQNPDGSLSITLNGSSNPTAIAAWLKAHPDDMANHIAPPPPAPIPIKFAGPAQAADTGITRGVQDVGNTLMEPIDYGRDWLSKATGVGDPTAGQRSILQNQLQNAQFQSMYGSNPFVTAGRIGGNILATAPILAATGGLAGAGLEAAGLPAAADFIGGTAGGNALMRGASLATNGALQGGQVAALTSSASDKPLGQQIGQGMLAGAVLSPVARAVSNVVAGGTNRLLGATSSVSPDIGAMADEAVNKFGIPLRVGQVKGAAGDRSALTADSELLGSSEGFRANNQAQRSAFTQAAMRTAGSTADQVTPSTMQDAKITLGAVFNRVAANTTIGNTDALQNRIGDIIKEAQSVLPDNEVTPLLKQAENIGSVVNNGQISGDSYQALTRSNAPLDRLMDADNSNVSHYASQIRSALDDALEASAAPEDLSQLRAARFAYKNLMTIAKIAPKADASGNISPALLRGAVNSNFDNAAFQGAGDLGHLAQIGQTFMKEAPNSFTKNRAAYALGPLAGILGAGGEGAALFLHDPKLAAATAAGVLGSGAIKGASRALQEYQLGPALTNRLIQSSVNPRPPLINVPSVPLPSGAAGALGYNRLMLAPQPAPPQSAQP